MEYDSRVNERLMQTTEEKVDSSKALDASLVIIESNGTESQEQDTSSRSGNDAHVDDADIRPIDNKEPGCCTSLLMIYPLLAKLMINMKLTLRFKLLESENVCLKKTVAQVSNIWKLEAHCINLELQLQMENNVLKSGQQSQFLKEKENEQSHKENEHLKQTYKDLFDSIKRTRVQTKNQNDSLMEQLNKKSNENADVLAQIQKKGFAIAA
ncbi:hypothetical protein Tco_1174617 [Tanacetum coccineum]